MVTSEYVKNGIVTDGHRLTAITITATSECVKNRIAQVNCHYNNGHLTGCQEQDSHRLTAITVTATSVCQEQDSHRLTAITITATSQGVKNKMATG